ncbi:MAG TPA: metal-dependent transcriptional regulator [Anaerolineae bacterium]|nr:metal-dependent transcriptional regulator [Anaerolineae bacterium]HQI84454.1 metal-dependent transcriptional regulator [Anaerolineae bacterium]
MDKEVTVRERVEDYLGAICRLRVTAELPVPLSLLGEHFGFSPVSIHEMILKLSQQGWIHYYPYRGVTLSAQGEAVALALLRRHRLWERFLTDMLDVPWAEAHEIAGALEHAAPESVTERLSALLGDPVSCPHGVPIPPSKRAYADICLRSVPVGARGRVTRIAPESGDILREVQAWGLLPDCQVTVLEQRDDKIVVQVEERLVNVPLEGASVIWVEVL